MLLLAALFLPNNMMADPSSGSQNIGWGSTVAYLDWSARLKVTVLTEDGSPLESAWVYIIDAYSRGNVTAALTDENGNAGTLFLGQGNAAGPLRIEPGDRADIGFNLLRGWYWLDEDKMLTGEAVNPDWDPISNNIPPQPMGDEFIQYITFNGRTGWARFFGKYFVIIYYKYGGCPLDEPDDSQIVFDSYTDEPQHQYIYLGILPEGSSAEYSVSQAKIFRVKVGDMKIVFKDAMGRPLENVSVVFDKWGISGLTDECGGLLIERIPLPAGTSYALTAEWTSRYGTKAVIRTSVEKGVEVIMPIYDVTLELLTPKGQPIVGADVTLGKAYLGKTDADGRVLATQVPAGRYGVSARWLGSDLALHDVEITPRGEITITPSNVYTLTVIVRGAQGQALEGSSVVIFKDDSEVIRRLTDKGGNVEVELPEGNYVLEVSFDS
ncbi:MAG: carboxypeptidase-like regulatory domain-containing protein, partial [Thermoproteota archaeon]